MTSGELIKWTELHRCGTRSRKGLADWLSGVRFRLVGPRKLDHMSAEHEELARLVQELPEDEVPRALAELRKRVHPVGERPWPPGWFVSLATSMGPA